MSRIQLQHETVTDEPFLNRWSRLKQQDEPDEAPGELTTAEPEPPPLTDADMPPLESLTDSSDYSGFLSPEVSESLRQLALRKLFHTAAFNQCDGLDDYADDFTQFEKLADIVTADMKHRVQQLLQQEQQESESESPATPVDADESALADQADTTEPPLETV